jgi:hypothetical protein
VSYTECVYCILQDNFINLAKQGYAAYEQAQQGQGQQNLGGHTQDQQQQHDYQHKEGEQALPGKHIITEAFVTDTDEPHFLSQNVFSGPWPSSTDREHPIRSIRKQRVVLTGNGFSRRGKLFPPFLWESSVH